LILVWCGWQTWKDALKADEEKDVKSIAAHVVHHVVSKPEARIPSFMTYRLITSLYCPSQSTTLARQPFNANDSVAYQACALAIRDELIRRWNTTTSYHTKVAPKRAYYFSLEYLMVSRIRLFLTVLDVDWLDTLHREGPWTMPSSTWT
jgi:starch phosphorylase